MPPLSYDDTPVHFAMMRDAVIFTHRRFFDRLHIATVYDISHMLARGAFLSAAIWFSPISRSLAFDTSARH